MKEGDNCPMGRQTVTRGDRETHTHTHRVSAAVNRSGVYLSAAPVNEAIYFPHSVSGSHLGSLLFTVPAPVPTDISI